MANDQAPRPNLLRDVPTVVWIAVAAILIALAIGLHGIMPRYEFSSNGSSVVVYDRWTGRFQRATYNEQGEPTLSQVVRPF
jgi:hypothetical protein